MSDNTNTGTSGNWPGKIVVTLRAGGAFFAIANVICVAILAWAYLTVKLEPKTLAVTGSARKAILSDRVTWSATVTAKDENLVKAYDAIKVSADKAKAYIVAAGIPESDITLSAISTARRFHKEVAPGSEAPDEESGAKQRRTPVLITTDKVDMYTLSQTISVSSSDMKKVPEISHTITSLIKEGVEIDSGMPSYLYTKLSELKIDMLAEATKDATSRAEQIVNNANGRLGKLVEARMGVMQINPKGITAVSGEGNNDTTSLEKEITAVVAVKFEVR
jgi:hypothetical protein